MKSYKCPLCNSTLTKSKYEAVLHIQKEKEETQKADLEKLQRPENQINAGGSG